MAFGDIKGSIQRFCDGTSCHGYVELFHAKTIFWRVLWIIICGIALGLTIYQVQGAIREYVNSNSDTVILPAVESEIMYPPMFLCYHHWLQWVDFKIIAQKGYAKSTVLYSLNYFTPVYSQEPVNVDSAQDDFIKLMSDNGYHTLQEYYNSIARLPPIINYTNLTEYFDSSRVVFENPVFFYCYAISSDSMKKYFLEHPDLDEMEPGRKLLDFSVLGEHYNFNKNEISTFITQEEYIEYMKFWIQDNTDWELKDNVFSNLTNFAPPIRLLPNGWDDNDVSLMPEVDDYNINFRATSCEWLSRPNQPCVSGVQSITSNESCEFTCLALSQKTNCFCLDLHLSTYLNADFPKTTCRDEFYTLHSDGSKIPALYNKANNTQLNQGCKVNALTTDSFKKCFAKCITPCRTWNWEFSAVITPMPSFAQKVALKRVTDVYIEYPMSIDILTMREEVGQSWENFVGNVGGLLGIWTGASIVSVVQLFYLCCCVDLDHVPTWAHANRHKPPGGAISQMISVQPKQAGVEETTLQPNTVLKPKENFKI